MLSSSQRSSSISIKKKKSGDELLAAMQASAPYLMDEEQDDAYDVFSQLPKTPAERKRKERSAKKDKKTESSSSQPSQTEEDGDDDFGIEDDENTAALAEEQKRRDMFSQMQLSMFSQSSTNNRLLRSEEEEDDIDEQEDVRSVRSASSAVIAPFEEDDDDTAAAANTQINASSSSSQKQSSRAKQQPVSSKQFIRKQISKSPVAVAAPLPQEEDEEEVDEEMMDASGDASSSSSKQRQRRARASGARDGSAKVKKVIVLTAPIEISSECADIFSGVKSDSKRREYIRRIYKAYESLEIPIEYIDAIDEGEEEEESAAAAALNVVRVNLQKHLGSFAVTTAEALLLVRHFAPKTMLEGSKAVEKAVAAARKNHQRQFKVVNGRYSLIEMDSIQFRYLLGLMGIDSHYVQDEFMEQIRDILVRPYEFVVDDIILMRKDQSEEDAVREYKETWYQHTLGEVSTFIDKHFATESSAVIQINDICNRYLEWLLEREAGTDHSLRLACAWSSYVTQLKNSRRIRQQKKVKLLGLLRTLCDTKKNDGLDYADMCFVHYDLYTTLRQLQQKRFDAGHDVYDTVITPEAMMRQKESQVIRNSLGGASSSSSVKRKHSESNRRMLQHNGICDLRILRFICDTIHGSFNVLAQEMKNKSSDSSSSSSHMSKLVVPALDTCIQRVVEDRRTLLRRANQRASKQKSRANKNSGKTSRGKKRKRDEEEEDDDSEEYEEEESAAEEESSAAASASESRRKKQKTSSSQGDEKSTAKKVLLRDAYDVMSVLFAQAYRSGTTFSSNFVRIMLNSILEQKLNMAHIKVGSKEYGWRALAQLATQAKPEDNLLLIKGKGHKYFTLQYTSESLDTLTDGLSKRGYTVLSMELPQTSADAGADAPVQPQQNEEDENEVMNE